MLATYQFYNRAKQEIIYSAATAHKTHSKRPCANEQLYATGLLIKKPYSNDAFVDNNNRD